MAKTTKKTASKPRPYKYTSSELSSLMGSVISRLEGETDADCTAMMLCARTLNEQRRTAAFESALSLFPPLAGLELLAFLDSPTAIWPDRLQDPKPTLRSRFKEYYGNSVFIADDVDALIDALEDHFEYLAKKGQ